MQSTNLKSPQANSVKVAKARGLKKGYMLNTFPGKQPLIEKFRMLKAAGFDGVEPSAYLDQEEVLRARDETGLEIPSLVCGQWTRSLSSGNPVTRKYGLDGLIQALHDAKRYGASSILVVPGDVNEKNSYADAYTRTQTEIRKAVPLAEELGIVMAMENVWNHFLFSPLEAVRYVEEFNSKAVGWHFDVGNLIAWGWPEQWIRILGKRIQKLHIKEYSRTKAEKEGVRKGFAVEYLEGDNDWPAVMRALDEVGYEGWGIAEPAWQPPDVPMAERLRTISGKMDKIFAL